MVGGQDGGDDLDVVAESMGEERPDGPVHEAGGLDGDLARAPLPLEKTAGDLAGGIHLLFEVAGQREEVDSLTGFGRGGGHQDQRITAAHRHRAAGLSSQPAGLEGDRPVPDFRGYALNR